MSQLLRALGLILVLGGLGHSIGVIHFYLTRGVPDANRVLLDTWVAEAQIIGGGLYLAAFRALRAGSVWKGLTITGALTVLAYAVPFIPILFVRAPVTSICTRRVITARIQARRWAHERSATVGGGHLQWQPPGV